MELPSRDGPLSVAPSTLMHSMSFFFPVRGLNSFQRFFLAFQDQPCVVLGSWATFHQFSLHLHRPLRSFHFIKVI